MQVRYHEIARYGRKITVGLVGGTVLGGGIAMLALPGPGLVVVALGLAILAGEFAWADRARQRVKRRARRLAERAQGAHRAHRPRVDRRAQWRHGRLVAPGDAGSARGGPGGHRGP